MQLEFLYQGDWKMKHETDGRGKLPAYVPTHDNACYVKSQETELLPPDWRLPLLGGAEAAASAPSVSAHD
jgi:hypothetical protein